MYLCAGEKSPDPPENATKSAARRCSVLPFAVDLRVSGMIVDRFEVFGFNGIAVDSLVLIQLTGNIANKVFDELWIIVRFFGDILLVRSFEQALQFTTRL